MKVTNAQIADRYLSRNEWKIIEENTMNGEIIDLYITMREENANPLRSTLPPEFGGTFRFSDDRLAKIRDIIITEINRSNAVEAANIARKTGEAIKEEFSTFFEVYESLDPSDLIINACMLSDERKRSWRNTFSVSDVADLPAVIIDGQGYIGGYEELPQSWDRLQEALAAKGIELQFYTWGAAIWA